MRHLAILLLFITGCSTAPVADLLDYFKPGKIDQGKAAPYGGVCGPQQVGGPSLGVPIVPAQPFAAGPALPGPPLANPPSQGTPLPAPDFGMPPAGALPGR